MRSRRRLFWAAALALPLVLGAGALLAVRSARRVIASCHPPRKPIGKVEREHAHAEIPELEEVSFPTTDALTLRGFYVPARRRAAVILVHGGWDNRMQMMPEMRILAAHGYGVLAYDTRASGESDGDLVTFGDREQRDVAAALDFVSAQPDVDPTRIGLLGFSNGASAVAMTAAGDERARAVLLLATWTSLEDETRHKEGKYGPLTTQAALWALGHEGIELGRVRPVDVLAKIHPRPLFMVAGERDQDTPVPVMERLYAAAGEPKQMWIAPGAAHGGHAAAAPAEYVRRMLAFFDAALLAR